MSKLDKDTVIAAFTEAYEKANGKAPSVEAKGGWYSVDGGKNVRLAQLVEMTEELGGTATEKPAAPKAEKAKAEKPKAAAKPKTKAKSKSGFSVKAYWAEKILAENQGAIKPR